VKKKVLVVGAGPGGLTAAMILQHRGFDVEIFEKSNQIGGRNGCLKLGEYIFDLGPTFLLQKFTLDEMFEETGRSSEKYLDFLNLSPMYRLQFRDYYIDADTNQEKMLHQISKNFPGDEQGYLNFMKSHEKKFKAIFPILQNRAFPLSNLFNLNLFKALPHVMKPWSLFRELKRFFSHDELCLAFTFQSKYLGMSPWACPSLFTILAYIEHKYGIWHVKGGLSEISEAMKKVFLDDGGKIHLNSPVVKVLTKGRNANGIQLVNGEKIDADHVVVNADFGYAVENLFDEEQISARKYSKKNISKREFSCGAFMLYLGLDTVFDLAHHTIIFADDYRKNVAEIMSNTTPSSDMSIYVRNASINDETLAPAGHSALYVLVPTINLQKGFNWSDFKHSYREAVIDAIERKMKIKNLRKHITVEKMLTPEDWKTDFSVFEGAVFNLKHIMSQMLYFRPHNKLEAFDNVFITGGGTHPGSGLPTIYESGRICANLISESQGVKFKKPQTIENYFNQN
jgi:phytoene desaturase